MLDPRADVARLCETDDRWTEGDLYEFVALADDFYRDTDFHAFFEDHAGLYAAGEELVNSFAEVDTSWFMAYYGRPFKAPELYLSFVNGTDNLAQVFTRFRFTESGNVAMSERMIAALKKQGFLEKKFY